jgi:excinuclease UvrABC nuclease subunit
MKTRKKFNTKTVNETADDKPIVYSIETEKGNKNYIGSAKKGRGRARLHEHLNRVPGSKFSTRRCNSIREAQKKEKRAIKKHQPKYNRKGK